MQDPAVIFFGAFTVFCIGCFAGWYLRGLRVPKVIEKIVEVPSERQPRDKSGRYVKSHE